jgi:hypothetical protein
MSLCGNYPNPFNDETIIHFNLAQSEKIELDIYDLYGTKTAVLARGIWPQGEHKVKWNAARMPSGIYFYRLRSDQGCLFGKMTLLH